ncbi:MAG: iron-sulfur cluster repair di-iron protein [Spirochaetales bacterium]|nr:iron-sulfur cluster repair di-iron protein [Spirochaetales bacterium]
MQKTIGELVAEKPGRSRVFEEHRIDYCCGGHLTIDQACQKKNLDPAKIEAQLLAYDQVKDNAEKDWSSETELSPIIDHILKIYHEPMAEDFERLSFLTQKVARVHGDVHPELHEVEEVWTLLRAELEPHLMKEERVLFPMMRQLDEAKSRGDVPQFHCGTVQNPMRQMEQEHEEAGAMLARLRELTADYKAPASACNSYRALFDGLENFEAELHKHIHLENYVLHPLARKIEASLSASPV